MDLLHNFFAVRAILVTVMIPHAQKYPVYNATIAHTTNLLFSLQLFSDSIYSKLIQERNSKITVLLIDYTLTYSSLYSKNLCKMDPPTATQQRSPNVNRDQKLQVL